MMLKPKTKDQKANTSDQISDTKNQRPRINTKSHKSKIYEYLKNREFGQARDKFLNNLAGQVVSIFRTPISIFQHLKTSGGGNRNEIPLRSFEFDVASGP